MSRNPHLLLHWREALVSTHGPKSSTTRHVLLTLSIKGDTDGSNMYPSISTLADMTGLTQRTVCTHLELAERDGWIQRAVKGTGRGWRRHEYHPVIPPEALKEIQHQRTEGDSAPSPRRTEPDARRTEPDDTEVLKEVQSTSSVTSPKTSPSPPEGGPADADPDRMGAEKGRKQSKEPTWVQTATAAWSDRTGGTASHGKIGRLLKPLVKQHGEAEVLRRWRKYLATEPIKYLSPAQFAEKWGAWGPNGRKDGGGPPEIDKEDLAGWNPISGDKKTRRRGRP